MRVATLLSAASMAITAIQAQTTTEPITGSLGNATTVENNPEGVIYMASLPKKEFKNPEDPRGNVKGSIMAIAGPGGVGTQFTVTFSNLPTSGGPFLYHLHVAPVPSNGNCTSTLAHLDPFIRGEATPCDPAHAETCQVGDLSGKYGKITSDPFMATYVDPFTSIVEGPGSFFGNRSFVVHFANKTRITCANFELVSGKGDACSTSATPSKTSIKSITSTTVSSTPTAGNITTPSSPTTSAQPPLFTGAAATVSTSLFAVFGIVAATFLL